MSMIKYRHSEGRAAADAAKPRGYRDWPVSVGHAQAGATLFTALIFLIMLILLGVGAAQMSGLEERMAGNTRNRDLAFQAAQAALSYVQDILSNNANSFNTCLTAGNWPATGGAWVNPGYRTIDTCLPNSINYWNGSGDYECNNSSNASSLASAGAGGTVAFAWPAAPVACAVTAGACPVPGGQTACAMPAADILAQIAAQPQYVVERYPDILPAAVGNSCPSPTTQTQQKYRVTARGVGGDSNAVVVLQSVYTVCF